MANGAAALLNPALEATFMTAGAAAVFAWAEQIVEWKANTIENNKIVEIGLINSALCDLANLKCGIRNMEGERGRNDVGKNWL